jgi:hypothetical protein
MPHHYNAGPRDEKMPSVTREGKKKKKNKDKTPSGGNEGSGSKTETNDDTDKNKVSATKIADALGKASDVAGAMKDPGLGVSPTRTTVRSGASTGASYIGSFDEYNTEDAAGRK